MFLQNAYISLGIRYLEWVNEVNALFPHTGHSKGSGYHKRSVNTLCEKEN